MVFDVRESRAMRKAVGFSELFYFRYAAFSSLFLIL